MSTRRRGLGGEEWLPSSSSSSSSWNDNDDDKEGNDVDVDVDDDGIEVRAFLLPATSSSSSLALLLNNNEQQQRHGGRIINKLIFKLYWSFFKTLTDDDGCWTRFVLLIASFTLAVNALVIFWFHTTAICFIVSGNISFALGIAVIKAQLKLDNMEELYEVHNRIRSDVNQFTKTNTELTLCVTKLTNQVSSLQRTENALHIQAMNQETSVDTLCSLVRQKSYIIKQKQQIIKENLIAKLMNCVLESESETDEGETLDKKEIRRMLSYMQSLKPLVTINEPLLRKAIKENNSTLSIMRLINDLTREGIQQGDRIFKFEYDIGHEEELLNRI